MTLSRFTWLVYTWRFVSEFMPIYPLYALMFMEVGGLSTTQVSILFAFWFFVALVSEIPTGTIADRFSRKGVLIISEILKIVAFSVWLMFPTFWGYGAGFLLWGLSFAFFSGAAQAYLFDELAKRNGKDLFTKIYTRAHSAAIFGIMVAYLLASYLAPDYTLTIIISMVASSLAMVLLFFFPGDTSHAPEKTHWQLFKESLRVISRSSLLFKMVVIVAITEGILGTLEEYVPLYYSWNGISTSGVPLLLAFGMLLTSIIAWHAYRFEHKTLLFLALLTILTSVIFLSTSFFLGTVAIVGMLVTMRLYRLILVLYQAKLQHAITESFRATIGSTATFFAEILGILLLGVYIVVTTYLGDIPAVQSLAIAILLSGILFAVLSTKDHVVKLLRS